MTLIVVGGIGFFTWLDIKEIRLIKNTGCQSKVVLAVSAFLILVPAIMSFFWNFSICRWENGSGVFFPVCDNNEQLDLILLISIK